MKHIDTAKQIWSLKIEQHDKQKNNRKIAKNQVNFFEA